MRRLKPVLDGDWWLIAPNPDLRGLLPGAEAHHAAWEAGGRRGEHNAGVDHHAFRGPDGAWHLWGCVRNTAVGRILYHWESPRLTASPWRDTREFFRCDRSAGECEGEADGAEWLQSPYTVVHEGRYYMLYGGHASRFNIHGRPVTASEPTRCGQICLMTSEDGRTWTRHRNDDGTSRVIVGPGEARDPCVIRIGDLWYAYYVGYEGDGWINHGFCLRTSKDMVNWADYKLVHRDERFAIRHYQCECPHVVFRDGFYYLFRTVSYYEAETHVFRSEDPADFGVMDSSSKYVGRFPAAAVEIYVDKDGQEYVSSSHNPKLGTQMGRLKWVADD